MIEEIKIIQRVVKNFNVEAYIVGGYPRDILMENKPEDIDIVLFSEKSTAEKIVATLSENLGKKPVKIDKNPFSVWRFFSKHIQIDISTPKGKTLKEDLLERDFTINTLVIPLKDDGLNILDPLGYARNDLKRKIIKTPQSPDRAIKSDPSRIVRIARFMSDMENFAVDENLFNTAKIRAKSVTEVPCERLGEELISLFLTKKPSVGLLFLRETGFFNYAFPDLAPALYKEQKSPYHWENVFEHCVRVVDISPRVLKFRIAAFFHDMGKAFVEKQTEDGRIVYWGHEKISYQLAKKFLERFCFPEKEREEASFIVKEHMINYTSKWSESAVRRLISKLGNRLDDVLEFSKYDASALKNPVPVLKSIEELKERINKEKIKLGTGKITSPLDGYEIQKILGIGPSRAIGEAKRILTEAVIENIIPPSDKEKAKDYLLKIKDSILV